MQKKIVDYSVVSHGDVITFIDGVKKWMSQGWEPFGSIATITNVVDGVTKEVNFIQPMVKYQP